MWYSCYAIQRRRRGWTGLARARARLARRRSHDAEVRLLRLARLHLLEVQLRRPEAEAGLRHARPYDSLGVLKNHLLIYTGYPGYRPRTMPGTIKSGMTPH